MESLITKASIAELHEQALIHNSRYIENHNTDELHKEALAINAYYDASKKTANIKKNQTLRIDLSIDELLKANRQQRKIFFSKLVSDIKAKLEIIRIERRMI